MKYWNVVAVVLVLGGTNLLTFATARYWTTKHVLTSAQERVDSTLKRNGLYEQVYTSDSPEHLAVAIFNAGGMYYWWNDAIPYWAAGFVLTFSGVAVSRYEPKKKQLT
jgi:hypothetical protein